jgi:hypothetical protein
MKKMILFASLILWSMGAAGQPAKLVAYVSEDNNRGFLNEVEVIAVNALSGAKIGTVYSDLEGKFEFEIPIGLQTELRFEKSSFEFLADTFSTIGLAAGQKVYRKYKLRRKPGYQFEVTMAAKPGYELTTQAINLSDIEVYNYTSDTLVGKMTNHNSPFFTVTFEQGNHYVILIRAPGFEPKRMDAHVNIDGCILCFEGVGGVRPGVSENLTNNNTQGVLLANVQLLPIGDTFVDTYGNLTVAQIVASEKKKEGHIDLKTQLAAQKDPEPEPLPDVQFKPDPLPIDKTETVAIKHSVDSAIVVVKSIVTEPKKPIKVEAPVESSGSIQKPIELTKPVVDTLVEVRNLFDSETLSGLSPDQHEAIGKKNQAEFDSVHRAQHNTLIVEETTIHDAPAKVIEKAEVVNQDMVIETKHVANDARTQVLSPEQIVFEEHVAAMHAAQDAAILDAEMAARSAEKNTQAAPATQIVDTQVAPTQLVGESAVVEKIVTQPDLVIPDAPTGSVIGSTIKVSSAEDRPIAIQVVENQVVSPSSNVDSVFLGAENVVVKGREPVKIALVSPFFSGYAIQVLSTKGELSANEAERLANLDLVTMEHRGVYSSFMTGSFETREEAMYYLKEHVEPIFPQAYVVKFDAGKRR